MISADVKANICKYLMWLYVINFYKKYLKNLKLM